MLSFLIFTDNSTVVVPKAFGERMECKNFGHVEFQFENRKNNVLIRSLLSLAKQSF